MYPNGSAGGGYVDAAEAVKPCENTLFSLSSDVELQVQNCSQYFLGVGGDSIIELE